MSWSTSELSVRLAPWKRSKPSSKIFYWPFQGVTSFVDHLCFFLMLSCLFMAAVWSPAGKGLTCWLLLVMFIVVLLLSHVVSWVKCGTWLYRFLIFAIFLTMTMYLYFVSCTRKIDWIASDLDLLKSCIWVIYVIVMIKFIASYEQPCFVHAEQRHRSGWQLPLHCSVPLFH